MKNRFLSLMLLCAALVSGNVLARASVPVLNIENVLVSTASGNVPTLAQVKQSIVQAGAAQNWQVAEADPGKLSATLIVRGKHHMTVDIAYSTTHYSLRYKSSVNLNYAVIEDTPVIHPNYNKWVQNFSNAIRLELSKL
jgi:hypothetical protein